MERCPTCGQPVPQRPNYFTAAELMEAMRARQRRQVYVSKDGSWHITHATDYPGRRVHVAVVRKLVDDGELRLCYLDVPDCYGIERTVDMEATLELRRKTGDKSQVAYA